MKYIFLVFVIIFNAIGCTMVENSTVELNQKSYIKSIISEEQNCDTSYYISLTRSGTVLNYSENEENIVSYFSYASGLDMHGRGYGFKDTITNESYEITFYINDFNDSSLILADYYYANPWQNIEGANIEYYCPLNDPNNPGSYFRYLGTNTSDSYFKINSIQENRICGVFKTNWKECCGGERTYTIKGRFSIPDLRLK